MLVRIRSALCRLDLLTAVHSVVGHIPAQVTQVTLVLTYKQVTCGHLCCDILFGAVMPHKTSRYSTCRNLSWYQAKYVVYLSCDILVGAVRSHLDHQLADRHLVTAAHK